MFENLIRSEQVELAVAAKNPFRVAQAYLITGKIGSLLETFVDRLEVAAADTEPEYVPTPLMRLTSFYQTHSLTPRVRCA